MEPSFLLKVIKIVKILILIFLHYNIENVLEFLMKISYTSEMKGR